MIPATVDISGAGEHGELQAGWSVNEEATPIAIGDTSGAAGVARGTVAQGEDSEFLINESFELFHDKLGLFTGHVSSANSNGATEATDTNIPLSVAGISNALTAERTTQLAAGSQNLLDAGELILDDTLFNSGMLNPSFIKADAANGWVYQVDTGSLPANAGQVVVVGRSPDGLQRTEVKLSGSSIPASPSDVYGFDASAGRFMIVFFDGTLRRLGSFDRTSGALLNVIGANGSGNGQFGTFGRDTVYVNPATSLVYVADYGNNRVQVFNTIAAYVSQFAAASAYSLAGSSTHLYVESQASRFVSKYTLAGANTGLRILLGATSVVAGMTVTSGELSLAVSRQKTLTEPSRIELYNTSDMQLSSTATVAGESHQYLSANNDFLYAVTTESPIAPLGRAISQIAVQSTTLRTAFSYYAALAGVSNISYRGLPNPAALLPVWTDSVWTKMKELAAAYDMELVVGSRQRIDTVISGNLVNNPKLTNNATDWAAAGWGTGGAGNISRQVGTFFNPWQTHMFRMQWTVAPSTPSVQIENGSATTNLVTAGNTYTFSGYVRPSWAGADFYAYIFWYNAGGGFISASTGTPMPPVGGSFGTRVSVTGLAPAGAFRARIGMQGTGAPPAVGNVLDASSFLFTEGSGVLPYFDGDTIDANNRHYRWSGAANASESTQSSFTNSGKPVMVVQNVGTRSLDLDRVQGGSVSLDISSQQTARQFDVGYSGYFYSSSETFYDSAAEGRVITFQVAPTPTFITLSSPNRQVARIDQPIQVNSIGALTLGSYLITDTDGVIVNRPSFETYGGSVTASIESPGSVILSITLGTQIPGTNGSYRFATNFGAPAFSLTGAGLFGTPGTVRLYTGADPATTFTINGSDVNNPFIANETMAYDRGIWRSEQLAGPQLTLRAVVPTTTLDGFGLTQGSLVSFKESIYRIKTVQIGTAWTTITATRRVTQLDTRNVHIGKTMGQVDTFWAGTKYKDQIIKPLRPIV